MKEILVIAKNILRLMYRKKAYFLTMVILPIVVNVLIMFMYTDSGSQFTLGVVNNDKNARLSTEFVSAIKDTKNYTVKNLSLDNVNKYVSDGKVDCAVIIPEGFEKSVLDGSFKNIEIKSIRGTDITSWIESFIDGYMKDVTDFSKASGGNKDLFYSMIDGYKIKTMKVTTMRLNNSYQSNRIVEQAVGMLVMFMLFNSNMATSLIIKEKRERTFFRILSSPATRKQYMGGNVFADVILNIIQIVFILISFKFILNINLGISMINLFVILLLFGIVSISFGILIVSLSESAEQAGNLATFLILPTSMVAGCMWPISVMPDFMIKIANFLPQRWAIDAVSTVQNSGGLQDAIPQLLILVMFAVVFFLIAAYEFKRKESVKNFI